MSRAIMITRVAFGLLVLVSIAIGSVHPLYASNDPESSGLRFEDLEMRRLVEAGREASPLFRAFVDRLRRSDVIVYVRCAKLRAHVDGELTFLGAGVGRRYVLIRLARHLSGERKIAMLG